MVAMLPLTFRIPPYHSLRDTPPRLEARCSPAENLSQRGPSAERQEVNLMRTRIAQRRRRGRRKLSDLVEDLEPPWL